MTITRYDCWKKKGLVGAGNFKMSAPKRLTPYLHVIPDMRKLAH